MEGSTAALAREIALPLPGMVPECGKDEGDAYMGFVQVKGRECLARVWQDGEGVHLEVDPELSRVLYSVQAAVRQRLERSADVHEFLVEFKDILERLSVGDSSASVPPRADAMRCIVEEIDEIGWERVVSVDEQVQTVALAIDDEAGRQHHVEFSFPADYPARAPDMRVATPRPFMLHWERGSSLRDAVSQFKGFLSAFQRFWDVIDDIDQHLWVLEPERPSRDTCLRRFVIGELIGV